MSRWIAICVSIISCLAMFARPALAWNDKGHMLIVAIAFDQLSDDERVKLNAILKEHPQFEAYLRAENNDGAPEIEWSLLRAATWPDFVRAPRNWHGDTATHPTYRFHRGPWHYINYPCKLDTLQEKLPEPLAAETDILRELDVSMKILTGKATEDVEAVKELSAAQNKAVRLCWLLHLTGDLHQPLHVTALVDPARFTKGNHSDEGGNKEAVRRELGAAPQTLHSIWDQLLGSDAYYPIVRRMVRDLSANPNLDPGQLTELQAHREIQDWTLESFVLAQKNVYHFRDAELKNGAWEDYFFKHTLQDYDVPLLPRGYESTAQEIAQRRIVLAGHRLAQLLKQVAAANQ